MLSKWNCGRNETYNARANALLLLDNKPWHPSEEDLVEGYIKSIYVADSISAMMLSMGGIKIWHAPKIFSQKALAGCYERKWLNWRRAKLHTIVEDLQKLYNRMSLLVRMRSGLLNVTKTVKLVKSSDQMTTRLLPMFLIIMSNPLLRFHTRTPTMLLQSEVAYSLIIRPILRFDPALLAPAQKMTD